jgi:hypothetical protein
LIENEIIQIFITTIEFFDRLISLMGLAITRPLFIDDLANDILKLEAGRAIF